MRTGYSKLVWTIGLMGVSAAAFAGDPQPAHPQEPVGFLTGGVIGAFAAGPIGAVIGAGLGTWLGNRVHRASEASAAEAKAAALSTEKTQLTAEKTQLLETNQSLSAKLDDLSDKVKTTQTAKVDESEVLDGLTAMCCFAPAARKSRRISHIRFRCLRRPSQNLRASKSAWMAMPILAVPRS